MLKNLSEHFNSNMYTDIITFIKFDITFLILFYIKSSLFCIAAPYPVGSHEAKLIVWFRLETAYMRELVWPV